MRSRVQRVAILLIAGWLCGAGAAVAEEPAATAAPSTATTVSGQLTSVAVDGLSPSVTVGATAVTVDRHSTTVSGRGHISLDDLKVGQQVSISGRIMPAVGRMLAKSITITADATPPTTTSPAASSSGAPEKPKAAPKALRSIPESEKR